MKYLFDLSGKVAFVTGGTRGIGLSIAKGLKDAGAKVYIHGTQESKTKEVAEINGFGYLYADLKSKEERDSMIVSLKEKEGKLDILVNNAGFESAIPILQSDETMLEDVYKVNAQSPFVIMRELVP